MAQPISSKPFCHGLKTPLDTVYLDTIPRLIKSELTVRSFGVKPSSAVRLEDDFRRYGFAFIINGRGDFWEDGRHWEVRAPAVIHHRPGHHYIQQPDPVWDEFYLTFSESFRPVMERPPWNLFSAPVLYLREIDFLLEHFERLFQLVRNLSGFGSIERFDLEATELLLDLAAQLRFKVKTGDDLVGRVRHYLEDHYLEPVNYQELASRFGVSLRHLRRLWHQQHDVSPSRYVLNLQIEQAKYLLLNTSMRIGEIAGMMNIADPLYFSRKFRQTVGSSPTEFRRIQQALPNAITRNSSPL